MDCIKYQPATRPSLVGIVGETNEIGALSRRHLHYTRSKLFPEIALIPQPYIPKNYTLLNIGQSFGCE
jgi:hypothetical protein